ncbi:DUF6227 family protein [Streptomyces sp. SAJ15]|uniref:DUF6227 family protein n=1 Tax=Streptomyces sp. SAJ15 TaxID=2011095 RepID=UPI00118472B6|nr:DUF6227 family protein [Streptomyces sp. SAJ15]TVL92573.1 hypothetical protein CD790_13055 [Streptomyces sp. SAJ15]
MGHSQQGGTHAELLDGLLARAQNGFEIDEALLVRLRDALMHQTELRSCRQCNEPRGPLGYSTYRHVFLLPDGSSVMLWELEHNTGADERPQYELYDDEGALLAAERRVHERTGGGRWDEFDSVPLWIPEQLLNGAPPMTTSRAYVSDNSPDHARRVLRRAENPDRPGEDVERLLTTAFAHDIALAPKPRRRSGGPDGTWCRFYEHAFLLADGDEISLWELEHNLTSDGRLVCEVYLDEVAAELAADRHARALGVEL